MSLRFGERPDPLDDRWEEWQSQVCEDLGLICSPEGRRFIASESPSDWRRRGFRLFTAYVIRSPVFEREKFESAYSLGRRKRQPDGRARVNLTVNRVGYMRTVAGDKSAGTGDKGAL
jgi:hypothetical protein